MGGYDGWAGASGSDCLANHDQLINELPEAKWVIIDRPREEAEASFNRVLPELDRSALAQYFLTLEEKLEGIRGLRIPFSQLFTERQLKRLAHYLGFEHNPKLAKQFCVSKIELHPEYLRKWESQQH